MEDVIHAVKDLRQARVKKAVRVGDEAEFHVTSGEWHVTERLRVCERIVSLVTWHMSRLGFLWLSISFGSGLARSGFFVGRRFSGCGEFDGADEQRGEESAAHKSVAEKFPRRRQSGDASGQCLPPAEQCFCVAGVVNPRRGVGDEIKQNRAEQSAAEQFEAAISRREKFPDGYDGNETKRFHQHVPTENGFVIVEDIERDVGDEQRAERQPPRHCAAEINRAAKGDGIGRAKILRQHTGYPRQREHQHQQHG